MRNAMMVRLRHIETVDFRRSEATNFNALDAEVRASLKEGDAVCFKNPPGNQVMFVVKPRAMAGVASIQRKDGEAEEVTVTFSIRLRLPPERSWNPLMLSEYAAAVGLELIGIKRLFEHLAPTPVPPPVEEPEPAKRAPRRMFVQVPLRKP